MLLTGAHEAFDRHDRRLHNTQFAMAGQAGAIAQQEGHGACDLNRKIANLTTTLSQS